MKLMLTIAISQVFIALYLLLSNKNLSKNNFYINYFLLFVFFHFCLKYILIEFIATDYFFKNLVTCFVLGYGPLLYLSVSKHYHLAHNRVKVFYHFIPFLIASVFYLIIGISIFTTVELNAKVLEYYTQIMSYGYMLSVTTYGILSLVVIYKNRTVADKKNSIRLEIISYLIFVPFAVITLFNQFFPEYDLNYFMRSIIYGSLILICIIFIQYLFSTQVIERKEEKKKYEKSVINDHSLEEMAAKLEIFVVVNKVYLDENITLEKLANAVGIQKHHLTQVLNTHFKKNFYKFINYYRIEEAKRLIALKKNDAINLLEVGFDCGFNSKTSFNRYFKMETSLTPSEYKKSLTNVRNHTNNLSNYFNNPKEDSFQTL